MAEDIKEKIGTIEGIQYLRGVASLMVVFFHARSYFGVVPEWTRIGSRGVDIFFVISGFIIVYATRNISNDVSAIRSSATFLGKRFIRVVPLYWIALTITAFPYFMWWFHSVDSITGLFDKINYDLVTIFKDYAFMPHLSIDEDEKGEIFPILIQGWTLNYEIAFYFLFGLTILARQYRIITAALLISGLVLLGKLHHFHEISALFYTSPILLEFVYGILLYEIYVKTYHLTFNKMTLVSLGVVGILLLSIGSGTNNKVVLGAASALIVWSFIQVFRDVHFRPLKILGDASYSIYLFHLLSFKLARVVVGSLSIEPHGYFNILTIIGIHVLVSVTSGIAVYYIVEKPMLRLLRKGLDRVTKVSSTWFTQLSSAAGCKTN